MISIEKSVELFHQLGSEHPSLQGFGSARMDVARAWLRAVVDGEHVDAAIVVVVD